MTLSVIALVAVALCCTAPEFVVALVLSATSVFGADYFSVRVAGLPFSLGFPEALGILCLLAGVAATLRRSTRVSFPSATLAALGLAAAWLVAAALSSPASVGSMLRYALAAGIPGAGALAGAAMLSATRRGQIAILSGLFAAGLLASISAFVEAILGRNLVVELGLRMGDQPLALSGLARLGIQRVSGAFDHPILLGVFIGLTIMVTMELMRQGKLSVRTGLVLLLLQFSAQVLTVSRAPILATLMMASMWMLARLGASRGVRAALFVVVALSLASMTLLVPAEGYGSGWQASGHLDANTAYRIGLTRALAARIASAPLLGSTQPTKASNLLPGFVSLDNEPAYLLASGGLFGLLILTVLLLEPLVHGGTKGLSSMYVRSSVLLLLLVGTTVAFFGLLVPYMFVVLGLTWGRLASPEEEAQQLNAT